MDGVLGSGLGCEEKFFVFEKYLGAVLKGTSFVERMRYPLVLASVLQKFDAWVEGRDPESVRQTWEKFLMKMEFNLADERVLEVVY